MDIGDGDDCCNWFCSCKVMLGKRSSSAYTPNYLHQLKEYQKFIKAGSEGPSQNVEPLQQDQYKTSSRFGGSSAEEEENDVVQSAETSDKAEAIIHTQQMPGPVNFDLKRGKKSVLPSIKTDADNGRNNPGARSTGGGSDNVSLLSNGKFNVDDKEQNGENTTPKTEEISANTRSSTGGYNYRNRSRFHKCSSCGKMFGQLSSLKWHEKEHVLEVLSRFKCDDCGKGYSTLASFERHLKTHPKCLLCGKSMTMKQVESQPEEECGINVNVCKKCRKIDAPVITRRKSQINGKGSSSNGVTNGNTNGNVLLHSEVFKAHEDDELGLNGNDVDMEEEDKHVQPEGTLAIDDDTLLFCDYCGAMFDCSEDFLPHYQKHGKVEFECRYCLLQFEDSDQVCMHEHTHDVERKFPCLFCPIRLKTLYQREFHELVHRSANCLACTTCGQAFIHKDRLIAHVENIHHLSDGQGV